jgi:hypothetical protein
MEYGDRAGLSGALLAEFIGTLSSDSERISNGAGNASRLDGGGASNTASASRAAVSNTRARAASRTDAVTREAKMTLDIAEKVAGLGVWPKVNRSDGVTSVPLALFPCYRRMNALLDAMCPRVAHPAAPPPAGTSRYALMLRVCELGLESNAVATLEHVCV